MKSNINGIMISVPESHSGVVPVSPSKERFDFEPYAFSGIRKVVSSGQTVFDIGASYGVMTVLMASLVGDSGKVYSFEANSKIIPYQQQIVKANQFEDRVKLHNYLIGDVSDREEDFYIVEGFNSVASTRNPEILKFHSEVNINKVNTLAIDDFCYKNSIFPDVLKIDIEGAEFIAFKGMSRLLSEYAPAIILETHGLEIDGIGGSLSVLCSELSDMGYELFDLNENEVVEVNVYLSRYGSIIGNLLLNKKNK